MLDPEVKRQIIDWLNTSITIREPRYKAQLARKLGISVQTIFNVEKEWRGGRKERLDVGYNPDTYLENKSESVDKALIIACEKGNATALQTYYKLTKRLIEQSATKVEIGFDATTIARITNDARRELEAEGYTVVGSEKVRPQPALLPEKIRQD